MKLKNIESNSKPVIILAGGFGTRLQGILKGLPKPLADINGTPFISYLLLKLVEEGYNNFILSLYYESGKLIEYIENVRNTIFQNCFIRYCIEPQPLGTGGAISFVLSNQKINGNFLVVNADTLLNNGYFLVGQSDGNAIGLVSVPNVSRYGKVVFDETLSVTNFCEKSDFSEFGYINAGIYHLNSNLFDIKSINPYSLEMGLFPKLAESKGMKAVLLESLFIDIGVPDDYYKFCSENKIE